MYLRTSGYGDIRASDYPVKHFIVVSEDIFPDVVGAFSLEIKSIRRKQVKTINIYACNVLFVVTLAYPFDTSSEFFTFSSVL